MVGGVFLCRSFGLAPLIRSIAPFPLELIPARNSETNEGICFLVITLPFWLHRYIPPASGVKVTFFTKVCMGHLLSLITYIAF